MKSFSRDELVYKDCFRINSESNLKYLKIFISLRPIYDLRLLITGPTIIKSIEIPHMNKPLKMKSTTQLIKPVTPI